MVDFNDTQFNIGNYLWSFIKPKDKNADSEKRTEYVTLPLGKTVDPQTKATLTPEGNVPLVGQTRTTGTIPGLGIESTTTSAAAKTKTEPPRTAASKTPAKPFKPGPTLDTQTKKLCGISDEKWETLSEEQKQEYENFALRKMIDDYNNDPKHIKAGLRMTVAEQYELYAARYERGQGSRAEFERFTRTIKAMEKEDQINSVKISIQCNDEALKDIAQGVISVDYTSYDKDNIIETVNIIIKNFSEENQVTAAQNAHNAPVETQTGVVQAFVKDGCKPAQMEIASKPGLFGIREDGTVDTQVQLACFETISTKSSYEDVTKMAASSIYALCKENQVPATDIIIGTNNEGAILAAASQAYKCADENQAAIKLSLLNTNYSEKVQTVFTQQEKEATQAIQNEAEEIEEVEASTSSASQKAQTELKIAEIEEKIKTKQDIKNDVAKLSDSEKIALLRECPSAEVVKAMIDLGASTEILSHISVDTIKQVDYKKMTGTIINFLSDDVQQYIVKQCADGGSLNSISREYLKAGAKKVYDKAIEEKQEKKTEKGDVTLGQ